MTDSNVTPGGANVRCAILGHDWVKSPGKTSVYGSHAYECDRCRVQTRDYLTPPSRPWLTSYPLEVDDNAN